MIHLSDKESELIKSCLAGDNKSFDLIYEDHKEMVKRIIYSRVWDSELTRDLLQETFLRVHRGLKKFEGKSSLKTWIARIALNICKDEIRRATRKHEDAHVPLVDPEEGGMGELPSPPEETNPQEILLKAEQEKALKWALDQLPEEQQRAMVLYLEGFRYEEIAEMEGVSRATIGTRIHYAKIKIMRLMKKFFKR